MNPEPWRVGDSFVGRKNGKHYAQVSPSMELVAFQSAVKEELDYIVAPFDGPYKLVFFLWRNQATYISETNKRVQKHQADATNMQKALEDALQGVVIYNDRDVRDVRTIIVEQGPKVKPLIIVHVSRFTDDCTEHIPEKVLYPVKPDEDESTFEPPVDMF